MIEEPAIRFAKGTDFHQALSIGFDEALTSLRESFYDLTDEQVWSFPLPGRRNVAWIVMHSLMNLDEYGPYTLWYLKCEAQDDHGRWSVDWRRHEGRYHTDGPSTPRQQFPTVREMLEAHGKVRANLTEVLDELTAEDLVKPVRDWWTSASDACMRTLCHTAAHVRQIWLLRGMMGWSEGQSWPHQHWA